MQHLGRKNVNTRKYTSLEIMCRQEEGTEMDRTADG